MLTPPQSFIDFQNVFGTTNLFIVELTDGATTWLFSNGELQLTDGHVYPLIQESNSIAQNIDIFTKQWSGATAEFELINIPYRQNASGVWVRPSDELKDIINNDANIYLACGGNVKSLNDCLLHFKASVQGEITYNDKTMLLTLQDTSARHNRLLPRTRVSAMSNENPPPENLQEHIPLIYGEWKFDFADRNNDLGLAKVFVVDFVVADASGEPEVALPELVISNDVMHTSTAIYADRAQFPDVYRFPFVDFAQLLNRQHAIIKRREALIYLYPVDDFGGDYSIDGEQEHTENHIKARDRDPNTFAEIKDFIDSGALDAQLQAQGYFTFGNYGTGDGDNLPMLPGEVKNDVGGQKVQLQIKVETATGAEWDGGGSVNPEVRMYYKKNGGDVFFTLGNFTDAELQVAGGTEKFFNLDPNTEPDAAPDAWRDNIGWHLRAGRSDNVSTFDFLPILYVLYGQTDPSDTMPLSGDGIIGNQTLLKVYSIRLKIDQPFNHDEFMSRLFYWFEGIGAKYGSWITGRSSAYADNDGIEDPAGIIEIILRDEVTIPGTDIDLVSFIDAENPNVKARINLHSGNRLTVFEVIRLLSEQSTFAFVWLAQGKARLVELNNSSPTTDRTIPWSHIIENSLEITKQVFHIVNDLSYDSRFRPETTKFQDINTVVTNSASDTSFGSRYYSAKWPNIAGSSATHVANHLVGNSDGIWANDHNVLSFETVGFSNADVEIGDWIELDGVSVDPQLLLDGITWSGKQFLVIELVQFANRTRIKALQLY